MSEHQWGPEDKSRIRACQWGGCAVRRCRRGASFEAWQAAKGRRWHPIPKAGAHCAVPIPPCTGMPTSERCSHVERPSGATCPRPALPRLVVCECHATPETFRLVILEMAAEIARLKSGG